MPPQPFGEVFQVIGLGYQVNIFWPNIQQYIRGNKREQKCANYEDSLKKMEDTSASACLSLHGISEGTCADSQSK